MVDGGGGSGGVMLHFF